MKGDSFRAGWALLTLRPGRSGWTGIALRALNRIPACPQRESQDAYQSPPFSFHKLSIVEAPWQTEGSPGRRLSRKKYWLSGCSAENSVRLHGGLCQSGP
jgi:hypothetical protein